MQSDRSKKNRFQNLKLFNLSITPPPLKKTHTHPHFIHTPRTALHSQHPKTTNTTPYHTTYTQTKKQTHTNTHHVHKHVQAQTHHVLTHKHLHTQTHMYIPGMILHSPILSGIRVLTASRLLACWDIYPNIDRIKDVKCYVFIIHGIVRKYYTELSNILKSCSNSNNNNHFDNDST